jgi:hypothetical protein
MNNKAIKKITLLSVAVSLALTGMSAVAKISAADAAKLDKELTPLGAVRAGNADGSIPAWTGGIQHHRQGIK